MQWVCLLDLDAHVVSLHHHASSSRPVGPREPLPAQHSSVSSWSAHGRDESSAQQHCQWVRLYKTQRRSTTSARKHLLQAENVPPCLPAAVVVLDLAQLQYQPIRSPTLQRVFRFWIDELVVPGTGAKTVERVLLDLGGTKTGSPPVSSLPPAPTLPPSALESLPRLHQALLRRNLQPEALGCCNMSEWDLLWSSHYGALSAVSAGLGPHKVVNALPGLWGLSNLAKLLTQLLRCYGEAQTFEMLPRSFRLPQQLDAWLAWIRKNTRKEESPLPSGQVSWLLKGRSSQPVPGSNAEVCVRALVRGEAPCPPLVAQTYIQQPLLVDGHKCHLQLWCLVTDIRQPRIPRS